jgi:AraC family transcriptional regulator
MDVRREQTRREYERRIEKAKNYIASNLREDIALRDIAAEAAFSEFHFHRIFSAFTGETIAHYIRRLRLEMGANRLQHDEVSTITAVGLECGFHNPAVFSRAFKERFGVTPELYRRGRRSMKAEAIPRIGRALRLYSIDRITITRFPSARVFFMSRVGPYDRSLVPLYRKVERHTRSIRAAGSFRMIGIPLDNPHVTQKKFCRYELGVPVIEGVETHGGGGIRVFSPGLIAVYPFEGMPFLLERGFDVLYGRWLPESGYQPTESPAFLVHHDDRFFSHFFRKTRIDVCLPITPL